MSNTGEYGMVVRRLADMLKLSQWLWRGFGKQEERPRVSGGAILVVWSQQARDRQVAF